MNELITTGRVLLIPAEASPDDVLKGVFVGVLVAAALVLLFALAKLASRAAEQERQRREREEEAASQRELQRQAELEAHRQRLDREYRQREERAERERQQALALTVAQLREAAEERFRGTLTAGTSEELDKRLREAQLIFSRSGRVITARVFISPTGWAGIEWMVDPSQPVPLRVIGRRDGEQVFMEYAYRGVYGDVLRRGREYTFSLEAYDGNRALEPGFAFTVKVPTERQWQRSLGAGASPDALEEQKKRIEGTVKLLTGEDELWEKARREGHKRIDEEGGTEQEKRRRKARLDAQIAQERDKEQK
jgi:hypothetical protein